MSSTPSVRIYGNSVRPVLFVFERSEDRHASQNAVGSSRGCSHRDANVTEISRTDAVNACHKSTSDSDSVLASDSVPEQESDS